MTALPFIIIGLGLGGALMLKKKDSVIQKTRPAGSETVRRLQTELNNLLPSSYPKLVVDGVWGRKTAAAFDKVMSMPSIDNTTKQRLKSVYYTIHGRQWQGKASHQQVQIDPQSLTGDLSYPKNWYIEKANELYDAMNKAGTDSFTIKKIFRALNTLDDYKALIKAFDYRPCTQSCMAFDGGDLIDWLWREIFMDPIYIPTQNLIAGKIAKLGVKLPSIYGKSNLYPK